MNTVFPWRDRRVLITGCTGMVGTALTRALIDRGAHVVGLIRDRTAGSELRRGKLTRRIDMVRGGLEDEHLLERTLAEYDIQTVFHLAGQTQSLCALRSPSGTFSTNIHGTWNLLEVARRLPNPPSLVVASTDKALGTDRRESLDESAPSHARHPLDVSKACADLIAVCYAHTYRLSVAVARFATLFGGGDLNWDRLVPGTIRSLLRTERPIIGSDAGGSRDYLYIPDAVAGLLRTAEALHDDPEVAGEIFHFANEEPLSDLAMVRLIAKQFGSDIVPQLRNDLPAEPIPPQLNTAATRRKLRWHPEWRYPEALKETIAWYRAWLLDQDEPLQNPRALLRAVI